LAARRDELQRALGAGWELRDLIGQGGFGEVWAAGDTRLKRDVAVKTLRSDLIASTALLERFQREAEAVARLRHPHIIPIYQVGEAEGLAFFVMPLVRGASLQAVLESETRLGVEEARRILAEAASALDAAHKAGIVHRDVKPENIMLDGDERRVLLMDFGIARAVGSDEGRLTGTGLVIGTPNYMSPEQASAERQIDHRSDIYSLGVVAWQMIAGRPLFDTRLARELVIHHITTPPEDLRKARPEAPDDLADAVMRCLRKDPADRWASAGDLASAVRPVSQTTAAAPSRFRRLRPLLRGRRRTLWYVAALLLTIGFAAIVQPRAFTAMWSLARAIATGDLKRALAGNDDALPRYFTFQGTGTPYRGRSVQLAPVNDTALLVSTPVGGPMVFNGTAWRGLDVPTDRWVFPPIVLGDTTWIAAAGQFPGVTVLHAITATGVVARDTVPHSITSAWSDGRSVLLGAANGALLRGRPRQWRSDPTGETGTVAHLWGDSTRQFGIFGGRLMQYNGMSWRSVDVGAKPNFRFATGNTLLDGSSTAAGSLCDSYICRSAVYVRESRDGRWRPAAAGFVAPFSVYGVAGRSAEDFFAYGAPGEPACGQGNCLWHVIRGKAKPVTDMRGDFHVIGVAYMRGNPYVLASSGALWTVRDGEWGVISDVPASVFRGVVVSPTIKLTWGRGLLVETQRRGFAPRQRADIKDVVIAVDSTAGTETVWFLTDSGALSNIVCRSALNECDRERDISAPDRRRVMDLELAPDGRLWIGGERGLLARRSVGQWITLATSGVTGLEREDILSISLRKGRPAVLLSTNGIYEIRPGGGIRRWRELGDAVGASQKVVAVPGGGAMVLTSAGVFFVLENGDTRQIAASRGTLMSFEVLDDSRVVLGNARPDDPLVGGSVLVRQFRRATGTADFEPVTIPKAMDVYGFATDATGLHAVGSGGFWIRIPTNRLPHAPSARVFVGSHADGAFLLMPDDQRRTLSNRVLPYEVPTGRARFAIWLGGCVLWDSILRPQAGDSISLGFRDPPCKP
jgi:tRNA A-37 threonylcarbamoyl transferase component Bud32